ncbi:MAG: hypothetical protein HEQ38_05035 [Gemmatimonas sp.]|nr:hypothetical protein [Gemmatimonas sp.]
MHRPHDLATAAVVPSCSIDVSVPISRGRFFDVTVGMASAQELSLSFAVSGADGLRTECGVLFRGADDIAHGLAGIREALHHVSLLQTFVEDNHAAPMPVCGLGAPR